jgi:hypothetical protein
MSARPSRSARPMSREGRSIGGMWQPTRSCRVAGDICIICGKHRVERCLAASWLAGWEVNDVACVRLRVITAILWLLICCNAISPPLLDVANGSRIGRRCGPQRAGCTWQLSWMSIHDWSLALRWTRFERRAWWKRLCGWHLADANRLRS